MSRVLYVYAIATDVDRDALAGTPAVDGGFEYRVIREGSLSAIASEVDQTRFSQDEIDKHAGDLQWLGVVGLSHQRVNQILNARGALPLRAFTLFSSDDTLREYLRTNAESLHRSLARLSGRSEYTLQLEFDSEKWNAAIERRSTSFQGVLQELQSANAGKAYLLKKKLEESRRGAAKEAEVSLLNDVRTRIETALAAPVSVDTRERRGGSHPQVNVLLPLGSDARFEELIASLRQEHEADGIEFRISGPWPPYTFLGESEQ